MKIPYEIKDNHYATCCPCGEEWKPNFSVLVGSMRCQYCKFFIKKDTTFVVCKKRKVIFPYGAEWEAEMKKCTKKELIHKLKKILIENPNLIK